MDKRNIGMSKISRIALAIVLLLTWNVTRAVAGNELMESTDDGKKVVVAYVTSWTRTIPDPDVMTHINYAFGHVNTSFDGVRIDNEESQSEKAEERPEGCALHRRMGQRAIQRNGC